jgi:hypothetical protein
MDAQITQSHGHSADVRIDLAVNGHVLSVAELGPGFVVLRDAIDHPPANAEITMSIDGHFQQWQVELIDGIMAGQRDTRIRSIPTHLNGHSAH